MVSDFQVVHHRLSTVFTIHMNPTKAMSTLGNKRMAGKKLGLFLQIVASCFRHHRADARLDLVQRQDVHKNTSVLSPAVQRRKGS